VDDRYVIMNAGDELRVRFPEAPAPAAGLVRDFVLVGDGWVKDGDYNTTFSRTVLPLPTHASGRYETGAAALEDDPGVPRAPRRLGGVPYAVCLSGPGAHGAPRLTFPHEALRPTRPGRAAARDARDAARDAAAARGPAARRGR
jgi:hypothetical protein